MMKIRIFKSVLPLFAFILAIGLAFATEAPVAQTGYYFDPSTGQIESVLVECNSTSNIRCEFNGQQVYAEPELMTPLFKTAL